MPERSRSSRPLQRLVQSSEFERALQSRSRASTPHFAVHHVPVANDARPAPSSNPWPEELSTSALTTGVPPVDDLAETAAATAAHWLGAVVPKRYARRSVTRSLLKRQIYGVAERHRGRLDGGIWVVRLRAPFDPKLFRSAASLALKSCARGELETLFEAATGSRP